MFTEKQLFKGQKPGLWFLLISTLFIGFLSSLLIPRPMIGVIYLDDSIYSYTAQEMIDQIQFAAKKPEIRAVVLIMNSPGGTVTDTESVYLELLDLRKKKPVITVIEGMAASGAYYLAVGTDYIFAKPSSSVGNIGVVGTQPENPIVMENVFSTGPYKLWGSPQDYFVREMEVRKQGFLQAVLLGRKDKLNISSEEVISGQIWAGSEALQNGLIDELGPQSAAFQTAADMALIRNYKIIDLRTMIARENNSSISFFAESPDGYRGDFPKDSGIYYLYIPSMEAAK